jgi:transcriptional regulator, MarR family
MDTKQTDEYLAELGVQEKQYDVLYRKVANAFELPDCSMWILYYLSSSENPLSQQDLIEKMMFPKQTINSAVTGMVKKVCLSCR